MLDNFLAKVTAELIVWVAMFCVTGLGGLIVQDKFGLVQKAKIEYYKFRNKKESQFKIVVNYKSSEKFNDVAKALEESIRENYSITGINSEKNHREIEVEDEFDFTVEKNSHDTYSIRSNKVVSGIGNIDDKSATLMKIVFNAENKVQLDRDSLSVFLYLPIAKEFIKDKLPKGIEVKDYHFALKNNDDSSSTKIELNKEYLELHGSDRQDIASAISKFV